MPRNDPDGILIAETGEAGEVTWVWILPNGERIPRPFRHRDVGLPVERFWVTGAHRDAIATWLDGLAAAV